MVERNGLRNFLLFRDLSEEELHKVEEIIIRRAVPKKTIIFHEGADKESVYFIEDGFIKAFKTDENGHEQIVNFLRQGDMFPHTGFFTSTPYPATAEAVVDSHLLAVPVRLFEQAMTATPSIAIKVMRVMSEKISELQRKLQELTGQDVQDRGISFLLKLVEQCGIVKGGEIHVDVPMTHQEFASVIGTTRETVNRLLNGLRKEGLVEVSRSGFVIHDLEALKRWTH